MPKVGNKRSLASHPKKARPDLSEDNLSSPDTIDEDEVPSKIIQPSSAKPGHKRSHHSAEVRGDGDAIVCEGGGNADFGNEMSKMLEMFGADINKSLLAKRKRLEQYTAAAMKANQSKVEELWKAQVESRQRYQEDLQRNVSTVLEQWDLDLSRMKEQEEKFQKVIQQQLKLVQQSRVVQGQRLASLRQIHDSFFKNLEDLDSKHKEQQGTMQAELKKELALLQKRILIETQQQEMANVRKSLQTMLFSS